MGNYKSGTGNYRGGFRSHLKEQVAELIVNNSETYVNSDFVTPTLKVGKSYHIKAYLNIKSEATPDFKLKNVVTGMVAVVSVWKASSSVHPFPTTALGTEDTSLVGDGTNILFILDYQIQNVLVAGTFVLQFAQNVATVTDTIIRAKSYWIVEEI